MGIQSYYRSGVVLFRLSARRMDIGLATYANALRAFPGVAGGGDGQDLAALSLGLLAGRIELRLIRLLRDKLVLALVCA